MLRSLGCPGWTRSNGVETLHRLEQTWRVAADGLGCGAAERHQGQDRGSPTTEGHQGPGASGARQGEARGSGDRQRTARVVGPWRRRGAAEERPATRFLHSQRPGSLSSRVRGPRSSSTCCRARTPRSANHPPARGSGCPARLPRPPGSHLLVGCGEVLSDHGTSLLRLTRDRDAAEARAPRCARSTKIDQLGLPPKTRRGGARRVRASCCRRARAGDAGRCSSVCPERL